MLSSARSAGRGTLPDALSMHSRCLAVVKCVLALLALGELLLVGGFWRTSVSRCARVI